MPQPKGLPPGIYLNLSMEEYHNDPAIGGTSLKDILISEERFWSNTSMNPGREKLDTAAFKMGRAYHSMVLEPEKPFPFEIKKNVQTTKAEDMIGEGDHHKLELMYARLLMQPKHWNALHGGMAEVSIFWLDEETGLMLKCRPDNFAPEWLGDLKTAKDISDRGLFYDFVKNGYPVSGYRYSKGTMALKLMIRGGYKMPREFDEDFISRFMAKEKQIFCFVMQEKNTPYSTRLWNMTPYASEQGASYFIKATHKIREYYENPKYAHGAQPLAYPDVEDITQGMIWENTKM